MASLVRFFFVTLLLLQSLGVFAAVQVLVTDQQGQPLEDAVVELLDPANLKFVEKKAEVKQQDLTFIPFVSAYQTGTSVDFPNLDKTRHHVYSFSPAKVFELKLYANKPEAPVVFDQAGIIALGCNIHDYMQAYIYVGDSQFLQVTDSKGLTIFTDVPDGNYQLKLWHPWQNADWVTQQVQIKAGQVISYQLAVTSQEKPKKPKKGFGASYTP
ncbi:methylamine utilization protein [Rheinheimera sediminis]|uniref:methylamine utilization protein n=1 Tax=Rheinheimera sp. YQF-1 TaxID=2499626 RepID=UPI000FD833B7|nr:methylamine utilization protein [Rheinheimera sp. YQF-1]RVT45446.1 methylamine utilization protein [Rheinheimera sp. YQF-1]